jgi:FtsZ-interacting cell division protein YlmF
MVYLGLQDDDEYAYDQYDDGYGDQAYPQGPYAAGYDGGDGNQHAPPNHVSERRGNEYGEPSGRPNPGEPRDMRPMGEPREAVVVGPGGGHGHGGYGEPTVRSLRRDEPPSGVSMPRPAVVRAVPTTAAKVHVVEPRGFNDAQEIGDRVKSNQAVILNLQASPRELQRRLIDFSSGLAYAVGGSMSRVADSVFLLAPTNVELSEEEKERLEARGLYRRG